MNDISFSNPEIISLVILPMFIFVARVLDVTFGTVRIIFVSRGKKLLAPLFGFFEIIIWLFAIGEIFQNYSNITYYLAYAGGFALGNFVGIWIEEKMAIGTLVVRVITRKNEAQLIESLISEGYGVTSVDAYGKTGKVKIIFTIIKRRNIQDVLAIINKFDPNAFYSIEEVQSASKGVFPSTKTPYSFLKLFRLQRPGK